MFRSRVLVAAVIAIVVATVPAVALAADPQPNDQFADATEVTVPFSTNLSTETATTQAGEPVPPCVAMAFRSVWYKLTPSTTAWIRATLSGDYSSGFVALYAASGPDLTDLSWVTCADQSSPQKLTNQLAGGQTYYLQVGETFDQGTGRTLSADFIAPPANDGFSDATLISALPYDDPVDATAATVEVGEPSDCGNPARSVWYSFTPSESTFVMATTTTGAWAAAYTGSSLGALTNVACTGLRALIFHADAGTTYSIQVAQEYWSSTTVFHLDVAPPAVVFFGSEPVDPSTFDDITFSAVPYDPGTMEPVAWQWSFGDGGTSTEARPQHRYATDGGYFVEVIVTMADGRVAHASRYLSVSTHDVSISDVGVGSPAKVGQTKVIGVKVSNHLRPELVKVDLYRVGQFGSDVQVGSLILNVPVLAGNETTKFSFKYVFTADDAAAQTVSFKAVATMLSGRDARPDDNTAFSREVIVR